MIEFKYKTLGVVDIMKKIISLGILFFIILVGCKNNKATKENYDKINNGMSYEQVIEIMGDNHVKSEVETANGKEELWNYNLGKKPQILIIFENGMVADKAIRE